jgi:hypothetical protein
MDLSQLLISLQQRRQAPTELWQPDYCGEIPLRIDSNGQWYYQESLIQRQKIVRLFASVLACDGTDYFLITPHEKVKIQVDDAPFIITQWQVQQQQPEIIVMQTNLGEQIPLSTDYPLLLKGGLPYIDLGKNLHAKVHRNVYYQWLEIAIQRGNTWLLDSAGSQFILGQLTD